MKGLEGGPKEALRLRLGGGAACVHERVPACTCIGWGSAVCVCVWSHTHLFLCVRPSALSAHLPVLPVRRGRPSRPGRRSSRAPARNQPIAWAHMQCVQVHPHPRFIALSTSTSTSTPQRMELPLSAQPITRSHHIGPLGFRALGAGHVWPDTLTHAGACHLPLQHCVGRQWPRPSPPTHT